MPGTSLRTSSLGGRSSRKSIGKTRQEEELLAALTSAARDWHAEIAEISGAMTGQHFDEETVEAMHVGPEAELEQKGYGHL